MGRLRSEIRAAARQQRRDQRHTKRSFGGRSAQDVHAELAFAPGAKCKTCGRRPEVRAITMAPLDEARKRAPIIDELARHDPERLMTMLVQIKENPTDVAGKPYVRLGIVYACESCAPSMEKTLAKLPSWVICETNRGPNPRRAVTVGLG